MTEGVTYLAAFGGGIISFLSPCVLPIVPGYLSLVTGLDVAEIEAGAKQNLAHIARDTCLFIAGFTTVFLLLQLSATAVSRVVFRNHVVLTRVSGLVLLAMGLFIIGSLVLRSPWLYQEKRFHPNLSRFGPFAAPVAGAAFGFGWTPCLGPILASVIAVASNEEQVGRGAFLLLAYSAGLGLPFLVTGLALGRLAGAFGWIKRHSYGLTLVSGASLCFFGVLLAFNRLTWVTTQVISAAQDLGLDWLVTLG